MRCALQVLKQVGHAGFLCTAIRLTPCTVLTPLAYSRRSASSSVTTSYGGDDFIPQAAPAVPAAPAAAQASAPAPAAPPPPTPPPPPAPAAAATAAGVSYHQPQAQPSSPRVAAAAATVAAAAAAAPSLESMAAAASTVAAAQTTVVASAAAAAAAAAAPRRQKQSTAVAAPPRPRSQGFTLFSFFPAFLGLINMLLNDGFVDVLLASGRTM